MRKISSWERELDRLVIQEDLGPGQTVCVDCGEDITQCECNMHVAS